MFTWSVIFLKRILALFVCFLMVFCLCACRQDPHHLADDNSSLEISIPEKQESEVTVDPDATELIGRWTLVSTIDSTGTKMYEKSYYEFRESGKIKVKLNKQEEISRYSVNGSIITIKSGNASYDIAFSVQGDKLTLTTATGTKHNLVRAEQ